MESIFENIVELIVFAIRMSLLILLVSCVHYTVIALSELDHKNTITFERVNYLVNWASCIYIYIYIIYLVFNQICEDLRRYFEI